MISSERRGLNAANFCFRSDTYIMRSLRLVEHYFLVFSFCLVSLTSNAFLSYFLISSINVFFIYINHQILIIRIIYLSEEAPIKFIPLSSFQITLLQYGGFPKNIYFTSNEQIPTLYIEKTFT